MRRRITLISTDAGPGHNCGLVIGLKKYGQVTTVWENRNPHTLDYLVPDALYGYRNIPMRGDDLIIVSCMCYLRLKKVYHRMWRLFNGYQNVHIVITDGKFARDPDYYNVAFKNLDVLTTACKRHFRYGLPTKTYYQPFDLSLFRQNKNKDLTIAHSPFVKKKFREKGTHKIIEATNGYNFDLITGVSWNKCLRRKAKAHIFIDQIDHYDKDKFKFRDPEYVWPALGKSGLEAMHLGCLTMTYGKGYDTDIPAPPVAWITEDTFENVLKFYIANDKQREELAERQYKWAMKYSSYDFAARNVLGLN